MEFLVPWEVSHLFDLFKRAFLQEKCRKQKIFYWNPSFQIKNFPPKDPGKLEKESKSRPHSSEKFSLIFLGRKQE
jgi:hypothetical protein